MNHDPITDLLQRERLKRINNRLAVVVGLLLYSAFIGWCVLHYGAK